MNEAEWCGKAATILGEVAGNGSRFFFGLFWCCELLIAIGDIGASLKKVW